MLETKLESLELAAVRFGFVRYSIPERQEREGLFRGITGEKAVSCMF